MKKTPTIFDRDWNGDRSRVVNVPHPDCAWVFAGEGVATRKLDGTCCLIEGGRLFKRRELRPGERIPAGFTLAEQDKTTGKAVGSVVARIRALGSDGEPDCDEISPPPANCVELAVRLVERLPAAVPMPHVAASIDGEIGLTWFLGLFRIDAMILPDAHLVWATSEGEHVEPGGDIDLNETEPTAFIEALISMKK